LVADSFAWPFRGAWQAKWAIGVICVLLLPLLFIPLLGYAIAATRAAELGSLSGPPEWRPSPRLFADGLWTAIAVLVSVLPFALLWSPLASVIPAHDALLAHALATAVLALPWGLLLLLLMPLVKAGCLAQPEAVEEGTAPQGQGLLHLGDQGGALGLMRGRGEPLGLHVGLLHHVQVQL